MLMCDQTGTIEAVEARAIHIGRAVRIGMVSRSSADDPCRLLADDARPGRVVQFGKCWHDA